MSILQMGSGEEAKMSENYTETTKEAKEALAEAVSYIFQTLKSLDKRIEDLENK